MEKMKNLCVELYKDKKRFVLVLVYVGLLFIYFLGMLMPFVLHPSLINGGKVSLAQFPGGTVYTLVVVALMLYVGFLFVTKKDKSAKKMFLVATIVATLTFLYGFLLEKVGLSEVNPKNGIGKVLDFLALIGMFFVIFGNKYFAKLIDKFVKHEQLIIESTPEQENIE